MKHLISVVVLAGTLVSSVVSAAPAAAGIPPNTTTVTNVCVVFKDNGVFGGGIVIIYPQSVSYRYIDGSDAAFLWLPDQRRRRVEFLSVTPIQPGEQCVGILWFERVGVEVLPTG